MNFNSAYETTANPACPRSGRIALSLLLLCAFGCGGLTDFSAPLPNNYSIVQTNSHTVMIQGPGTMGEFRVAPKIESLAVSGDPVVGLAVPSAHSDIPAVPGYFLLDTRTNSADLGLTEADWTAALRERGIATPPRLKSVVRFDTSLMARVLDAREIAVVVAFVLVTFNFFLKRRRASRAAR